MKTILYATDYSLNSVAALRYAFKLSEQMEARLVVTHVFGFQVLLGMEGISEPFPHSEENTAKHHRTLLEEFCADHLGNLWKSPDIQIEAVNEKSVVKGIISKATDWHAYLIVVGMKGKSAVREILVGRVTKQLIEQAPCPILAIPEYEVYTIPKTLVYASDFEEEDVYAVRKLAEMAKFMNADIKILHIATEKEYDGETQLEFFKELLRKKVAYPNIDFKMLFSEDVFESLRLYLEEVNADMVIMLEREKRSLFKKWFHRDLVKKMETYDGIPLLSFREGNHQPFYF